MSVRFSRVARPIGEPRGRSLGWWGAVLGLIAIAHLVVAAHVGAVYLRAASPAWPMSSGDPPGLTTGAVAAGLLVVAALVALVADVGTRRDRAPVARFLLVVAALVAAVSGWLRGSVTIFSDHPVSQDAFWSVRWLLGAIEVTLAWSLASILLIAAVHMFRGVIRTGDHAELAVVSLWAWATAVFAVGSWLVFAGITIWWGGV